MKRLKSIYIILAVFTLMTLGLFCASCVSEIPSPQVYTVQYVAGTGGTVVGQLEQQIEAGADGLTVTAIPNEGYVFEKWSDDVTTAMRQDKDVRSNSTVIAMFRRKNCVVRYETDGNGIIQGEISQTVEYGNNAAIVTAIPNEGYEFDEWSDGVTVSTRQDENIQSDFTVTALFKRKTYTVRYQTDGNGTLRGETNQRIEHGKDASAVTAISNEGYIFDRWSDGILTATRQDSDIRSDITITATFKKRTYTVRYQTDGNGTLQGEANQRIDYGKDASSVRAIPNEGYEFVKWSDGITDPERTDINVKRAIDVTAIFQKKIFSVVYLTNSYIYGAFNSNIGTGLTLRLSYTVAYGEDVPIVRAVPNQNEKGEKFLFLYWSDGVETEERQDKNVCSDLTVTAYFGYGVKYVVDQNKGGKIVGETYQKLLVGESSSEVTAVPDDGYTFCGWSDLSLDCSRSADYSEETQLCYYSSKEYVAYFEPTEKTFRYDYGIASGAPLETEITLKRDAIRTTEFVIPTCPDYTFCGWYADSEYRIRITYGNGRYLYGYAAFTLDSDTLYAKWERIGEEADNHKVLLVFVDEVQTELYSTRAQKTISAHTKMSAMDYEVSKWLAETFYNLLTEWFNGEVIFEVDSYYTTLVVEDGFTSGAIGADIDYSLMADDVSEVGALVHEYHNTITIAGLDDYEEKLISFAGVAGRKNGFVKREMYWMIAKIGKIPLQTYLADLKAGKIDLDGTALRVSLHEFAHTAEMYYPFDEQHSLHGARYELCFKQGASLIEGIRRHLVRDWELDGVKCGIPMEYWKHEIDIHVNYWCKPIDGKDSGKVNVVGEAEDPDRKPWDASIARYVPYGSDISVEAIPYAGYRFVRWSDGVTTAVRHDRKIISDHPVYAILEKTN